MTEHIREFTKELEGLSEKYNLWLTYGSLVPLKKDSSEHRYIVEIDHLCHDRSTGEDTYYIEEIKVDA